QIALPDQAQGRRLRRLLAETGLRPMEPISPAPGTAAAEPPPGRPLAVYKARPVSPFLTALVGLALLAFGVWLIVFVGLRIDVNKPAHVWPYLLLAVPFGVGSALLGAWVFRIGGRYVGLRVTVYADGLERSQFGRVSFWPWEEVETIWYNANQTYLQG